MAEPGAQQIEVDLLIVGSGAGAITAALVAKDAGLEPLIIEKLDKVGGTTGYSGGVIWIPDNPLMAEEGVADSKARAQTYMSAVIDHDGPATSPERRDAFLSSGPEMVRYLQRKGLKLLRTEGYADYYAARPGGEPRSRSLAPALFDINALGEWKERLSVGKGPPLRFGMDELSELLLVKRSTRAKLRGLRVAARMALQRLRGKDVRAAGAALQGRLLQIALREQIPIWLDTAMESFVTEQGRVVGVVARRGGTPVTIRARAGVLLNAGGFARNAEMRERYGRQPTSVAWTNTSPGDTGEVLQAAMALGAATDCMDEAWYALTSTAPDGSYPEGAVAPDGTPIPFGHHFDISFPHVILVDQNGNRFTNEACSYMELGQRLIARHRETGKALPAWAIIESRHRDRYPWGAIFGKTPASWFETGYMKRADTLDALAAQCGIDPAGLRTTVERVNRFSKAGVDEDFGKGDSPFDRCHGDRTVQPNPNLGAIERPPFYAVAVYPGIIGTAGGLVTDVDGRVLTDTGSPIPGLYATGNTTASVMGRSYLGAGATLGPAMVFAYRAALAMAGSNSRNMA